MEVGDEDVDYVILGVFISEAHHGEQGAKVVAEGEFAVDAEAGENCLFHTSILAQVVVEW